MIGSVYSTRSTHFFIACFVGLLSIMLSQGELNPEVLGPLKEILRLVEKKDSCR